MNAVCICSARCARFCDACTGERVSLTLMEEGRQLVPTELQPRRGRANRKPAAAMADADGNDLASRQSPTAAAQGPSSAAADYYSAFTVAELSVNKEVLQLCVKVEPLPRQRRRRGGERPAGEGRVADDSGEDQDAEAAKQELEDQVWIAARCLHVVHVLRAKPPFRADAGPSGRMSKASWSLEWLGCLPSPNAAAPDPAEAATAGPSATADVAWCPWGLPELALTLRDGSVHVASTAALCCGARGSLGFPAPAAAFSAASRANGGGGPWPACVLRLPSMCVLPACRTGPATGEAGAGRRGRAGRGGGRGAGSSRTTAGQPLDGRLDSVRLRQGGRLSAVYAAHPRTLICAQGGVLLKVRISPPSLTTADASQNSGRRSSPATLGASDAGAGAQAANERTPSSASSSSVFSETAAVLMELPSGESFVTLCSASSPRPVPCPPSRGGADTPAN